MKVTEAFWDTETLGIPTLEIVFEPDDDANEREEQLEIIRSMDNVYCVVKAPISEVGLYQILNKHGFAFVESQLLMRMKKKDFGHIQKAYGSLFEKVDFVTNDSSNIDRVFREIDSGLFSTDRIALDPDFGIKLANLRYKKWLLSCLDSPLYKIEETLFQGRPVGFSMTRLSKPIFIGLLGASYQSAMKEGHYINGVYNSLLNYFAEGYTIYQASISSNNYPVLKVNQTLGVSITEIQNVFTYKKRG